jgi:hypothetical protein
MLMKAVISRTSSVSGMTTPAILSAAVVDMCNSWSQRVIGFVRPVFGVGMVTPGSASPSEMRPNTTRDYSVAPSSTAFINPRCCSTRSPRSSFDGTAEAPSRYLQPTNWDRGRQFASRHLAQPGQPISSGKNTLKSNTAKWCTAWPSSLDSQICERRQWVSVGDQFSQVNAFREHRLTP